MVREWTARAVAQLRRAAATGELESRAVERLLEVPGGYTRMLRAVEYARRGQRAKARADVDRALEQAPFNPVIHLVAGVVLHATRDYGRSLEQLWRAAEFNPRALAKACQYLLAYAGSLGWDQDVREALEKVCLAEPDRIVWRERAAQMYVRCRDYRAALRHVKAALRLEPGSRSLHMRAARLHAALAEYPDAIAAVEAALERGDADAPAFVREVAEAFTEAGAIERARARYQQLIEDPREAAARAGDHVTLGGFALWALERDEARARAEAALAIDESCAGGHRLLGALAVLEGQHEAAIAPLERALELDPRDYEAHVWRAEAALRLADYGAVHQHLHHASMKADGLLFVAWMLRFLAVTYQNDLPDVIVGPHRTEEIEKAALELCPGEEALFASGAERPLAALVERALTRLGGNRTTIATALDDGALTRLVTRTGARFTSRHALQLIRVLPPDDVRRRLTEVVDAYPRSSLPVCHRGELELWLGRLKPARVDLERAVSILAQTRWAYIGMTGIDILEGQLERAVETSAHGVTVMKNTEGPSVYIYRGEALRRLGRYEEALYDLTRSVNIHRSRVSAWVNLGLLYAARGQHELARKVYGRLAEQAPGLLADAAAEVGVTLWGDPGDAPTLAEIVAVLERSLDMMRGNRSATCVTYFTAAGKLRHIEHVPDDGEVPSGPHDDDARDLAQAEQMILRAVGLPAADLSPASEPSRRKTTDIEALRFCPPISRPVKSGLRAINPGELAQFLERGFVHLRGCFSRQVANEWVEDAGRRLVAEPERCVKGYDGRSLAGFSPSDPATWTLERLTYLGQRRVRIDEFAPRAWEAICDLLGGADRIATRIWTDDFVVNFGVTPARAAALREPGRPSESPNWHIDDPREGMRVDQLRHGLIVLCLFSDIAPGGGGTLLACESPGKIARMLAREGGEVDFVRPRPETVASLLADARDIHEVAGSVGDVILMHPLMAHAATVNRSSRIRWLANPLIELEAPLQLHRDEGDAYSVVERTLRRALALEAYEGAIV